MPDGYQRIKGYAAFENEEGVVVIASGLEALRLAEKYDAEPVYRAIDPTPLTGRKPEEEL